MNINVFHTIQANIYFCNLSGLTLSDVTFSNNYIVKIVIMILIILLF